MFFAFDALMLLADGKVVYLGTPNGSLEYVRDMRLECPGGYNAADHHMDLLVVDGAIEYNDDDDNDDGGGDGDNQEGENDQTGGGWRTTAAAPLRRRRTGGGTTTKRLLIESWDAEASAKRIEDKDAAERAMRIDGSGSAAGGASAPGDGGGTFVARVRTEGASLSPPVRTLATEGKSTCIPPLRRAIPHLKRTRIGTSNVVLRKKVTINCVIAAKWWQLQKKQQSATVSAHTIK